MSVHIEHLSWENGVYLVWGGFALCPQEKPTYAMVVRRMLIRVLVMTHHIRASVVTNEVDPGGVSVVSAAASLFIICNNRETFNETGFDMMRVCAKQQVSGATGCCPV